MQEFDFVVVGAGSAGSVVASKLAQAGKSVLLLEAGAKNRSVLHRLPIAFTKLWFRPDTSWMLWSEPEPGLGGRKMPIPRGKGIGGSSAINGMLFNRGSPNDWDGWSAIGLAGWDYNSMLPYFRRVENFHGGSSELHGGSGPVQVNPLPKPSPLCASVLNAARQAGYPVTNDFAGEQPEGWSIPDFTIDRRGRRVSAATAYLHTKRALKTLTIETGASVRHINFKDGRATGVLYQQDGQDKEVHARAEIILACGAIASPQILMRSGIGPREDLSDSGINPVFNSPDVGRNLQDHIGCAFEIESRDPHTFEWTLRADRFAIALARWWVGLPSALAAPPVLAMGIVRTAQGLKSPDMRMLISGVSMGSRVWFPGIRKGRGPCMMFGFSLCYPKSRGRVTLNPENAQDAPLISYNALMETADVEELVRGYRLAREFITQPAVRGIFGKTSPLPEPNDADAVRAWIRQSAMITHHPIGTCRMGLDATAVVDYRCRVNGVKGLRVVDASIFPTQIGGNPNVPIMAIAEKISDDILRS